MPDTRELVGRAILARLIEQERAAGLRVAHPNWEDCKDWYLGLADAALEAGDRQFAVVRGLIQTARRRCADESPHAEIDGLLMRAEDGGG